MSDGKRMFLKLCATAFAALAQKMREAGVQVDRKNYPGTVHEFFGMAAVSDQAKTANAQAFKALRTAFRN